MMVTKIILSGLALWSCTEAFVQRQPVRDVAILDLANGLSRSSLLIMSASTTGSTSAASFQLDDQQVDFTKGYLNKHQGDLLRSFAETFSSLGAEQKKKNVWSGGSFRILEAVLADVNTEEISLDVKVEERGKGSRQELVKVSLDAVPIGFIKSPYGEMSPIPAELMKKELPVDKMIRKLNRLCWVVDFPEVTGKLIQMGNQIGGAGVGKIKENMYLNQVPHNRYVRQYFYDMAAEAAFEAVSLCSDGKISNRMKMVCMFPEMNPSMDSYRIGTILEMVRAMVMRLAEENLRVRVCVQGSMGVGIFTGVPKQLSGVSKLLQMMDWQSNEGETHEGMVGKYLNFGAVGKEHVVNAHTTEDGTKVEQDDVFIIIAPQSMVGIETSIMGPLQEMVEAAGDRPVIILNPDLVDKISSQGQQSVRGRKDRIDFADSFKTIWHFQNIYVSGTSYFPILGSMTKLSPTAQWIAHQRRDLMNNDGEIYVPVLAGECVPSGEVVLKTFER